MLMRLVRTTAALMLAAGLITATPAAAQVSTIHTPSIDDSLTVSYDYGFVRLDYLTAATVNASPGDSVEFSYHRVWRNSAISDCAWNAGRHYADVSYHGISPDDVTVDKLDPATSAFFDIDPLPEGDYELRLRYLMSANTIDRGERRYRPACAAAVYLSIRVSSD